MGRLKEISKMGYVYPDRRKKLLPWSMQVELHEGCDRCCWFCGIRTHYKTDCIERAKADSGHDLSIGLIRKVFSELNDWVERLRVEINSHGEPCLHPKWFDCIEAMNEEFPGASLIVQTNCKSWINDSPEEFIRKSFSKGLDAFVLNCYDKGYYEFFSQKLEEWGIPFIDYYYNNPDGVSGNSYYKKSSDLGRVILWKDLGDMNKTGEIYKLGKINKRLHNSGGNSDIELITKMTGHKPFDLPRSNRCSKVHREIILGWNGIIPISCQDWRDQFIMGDCNESDIRDIWYSYRWEAARQLLYNRRRDLLVPCYYCDDPTTRTGLDKDPELGLDDYECLAVIESTHKKKWGAIPTYHNYVLSSKKISPFYPIREEL